MLRAVNQNYLNNITSLFWRRAFPQREIVRRAAADIVGPPEKFFGRNYGKIAIVSLMAGAGTRWQESVKAAAAAGSADAKAIDLEKPRCLAPVEDVLHPERKVPVGAYTFRATKGLGYPVVIWGSHPDEVKQMVKDEGINDAVFGQQKIYPGQKKPLGHGDAARQALEQCLFKPGTEFVAAFFGGEVNSRETIVTTIMVLAALQELTEGRPLSVLPTTFLPKARYLVETDCDGFPTAFVQPKLMDLAKFPEGQSNVGVRTYTMEAFSGGIKFFSSPEMFDPAKGYTIPGNKASEFALDNIDIKIVKASRVPGSRGLFRSLCIARPEEVVPPSGMWDLSDDEATAAVKKFQYIPYFLACQRIVQGLGR